MSDNRRPSPSLLGSHSRAWIGAALAVLAVAAALAHAFRSNRPAASALASNREQHLKLRHEIEAKAQQALNQPGRNPDGTYRVPIDQVLALAAKDPRVLDAVRERALREQAAGK